MLKQITPLILTYNEQANIGRTLDALSWANEIIVVDSQSTDATLEICAKYANVTCLQRAFDQHAKQWNFGLDHLREASWVLALDADHVVSQDYVNELRNTDPTSAEAFRNGFVYCQDGVPLTGSLYPPIVALFKPQQAHYVQDGHTQRLHTNGRIADLKAKNFHDDRKPFARWYTAQWRYADLEAQKLAESSASNLRWSERARLVPFLSPFLVLFYTLIVKGVIRNGWPGIKYSSQRVLAEFILHCARIKRWLTRQT